MSPNVQATLWLVVLLIAEIVKFKAAFMLLKVWKFLN